MLIRKRLRNEYMQTLLHGLTRHLSTPPTTAGNDMSATTKDAADGQTPGQMATESPIYYIGALKLGIENQQLCLHYQPRYSCAGKLVSLEALVRWQHPQHGLLYPDRFIPLAEEVGLIHPLGLWVFERCCNDLFWLHNHLDADIKITINLSVSQLDDTQFAQKILDTCQRYYLSLSCFEFEVTGCSGVKDKSRILEFCNMLANAGAEFSLEDFGTATTPLEYLCLLPVSMIKLETDFINKLGVCKRSEILLRKLIELAHEMQLKIVAEGVEDAYQRDLLIKMGCDQLQGYMMHRPVELEKLTGDALLMSD